MRAPLLAVHLNTRTSTRLGVWRRRPDADLPHPGRPGVFTPRCLPRAYEPTARLGPGATSIYLPHRGEFARGAGIFSTISTAATGNASLCRGWATLFKWSPDRGHLDEPAVDYGPAAPPS